MERFNRTFRHAGLDASVFESLDQVREISVAWMREYNEERPHDTLDEMSPSNVSGSPNRWKFSFCTLSLTGKLTGTGHC